MPTPSRGQDGRSGGARDPDLTPVLRAVFDTNVVVSALVFGRRLAWVRRAWANGAVVPIVCRETATELLRVLAYPKFRLTQAECESLLSDYLPFVEMARLPIRLPDLPAACRDRDDAVFLHLTIASNADALVTGDSDLADLAAGGLVISPGVLRQRLGWSS